MSDIVTRFRLQQVASYRELCRSVRRSGGENVFFALLMLGLAYLTFQNAGRGAAWLLYPYLGLALAEFAVGLFKWVRPSAEGVLLDGLVLLLFAGWNLGLQGLKVLAGAPPTPWVAILGLVILYQSVGRFQSYGQLRRLFRERPTADQVAWFDDLVREIKAADPDTDDDALDLPTTPHWKAKLLGTTAFFVSKRGESVWVAGPDDFTILREEKEHGTGRRRGVLQIHDQHYPEFDITDSSWANYQKWVRAHAPAQAQS